MSQRTRYNKSKQKALRGELKNKAWKTSLPNLNMVATNKSRAGIYYQNWMPVTKVKHLLGRQELQNLGFLMYLQNIPFIGNLFR